MDGDERDAAALIFGADGVAGAWRDHDHVVAIRAGLDEAEMHVKTVGEGQAPRQASGWCRSSAIAVRCSRARGIASTSAHASFSVGRTSLACAFSLLGTGRAGTQRNRYFSDAVVAQVCAWA